MDANLQTFPIKLTLLGVPEVTDIVNFKDAMLDELKGMLSFVSNDGVGFTDVTEIYLNERRQLRRELGVERLAVEFYSATQETIGVTQTFHLYYDVTAKTGAKRTIELMRHYHSELVQLLHEYKKNYHYVDDFDVCALSDSSLSVGVAKDQDFDLCSYEHELIPVKFTALGIPKDLDGDLFQNELIGVYNSILGGVEELAMGGLYADKQVKRGDLRDFYFNVNVIQRDKQSMEQVITNALGSRNGKAQILSNIQNYTNAESLGITWCLTDSGQFSTQPCPVVQKRRFNMPTWQILTIALSMLLLVCGFCLWIYYVVQQRKQEQKELHYEARVLRRGQDHERKNVRRHRRHLDRHRVRFDDERRHHRRERRHRRHSGYDRRRDERRRRRISKTVHSSDSEGEEPPLMNFAVSHPPVQQQPLRQPQRVIDTEQRPLPIQSRQQVDTEQGRYSLQPGQPHRQLPPLPETEVLQIGAPVYCDEEVVNRPDPSGGVSFVSFK